MSDNIHKIIVWGSDDAFDEIEPYFLGTPINCKREKLTCLSAEPENISVLIVTYLVARQLASVINTYMKERKRKIAFTRPDGTKIESEGNSIEDIERVLLLARDVYIEREDDKQK